MNAVFTVIFIISAAILLIFNPQNFLPALLAGASRSATLCLALVASYAAWLGLMKVWEASGVTRALSRILKPVIRRVFKTDNEKAMEAIGMNLSANLLGIGGAATPYGIRAAKLLETDKNARYSSTMLFVLNAGSLQLIPTSVVTLRVALNSVAPAAVILPTVLATAFSILLGATLVRLFVRPFRKEKERSRKKTSGAGTRRNLFKPSTGRAGMR